ncbi:GAL4-like Zn(II)2Cys6 (or C6 zinc) binuclear cluster DNA-binding domain, partial [Rhizoctonia solani]
MADRYGPTKDSGRALHRGTGCHICRQRKVEIKKSKITLLRDEISELRKRIHELEGGSDRKPLPPLNPQQSLSPAAVPLSSWASSPALSDAHSINSFANQFNTLTPDQKPMFLAPVIPQMSLSPTYQQMSGIPGLSEFQSPILHEVAGWGEMAPSPNGALVYNQLEQPLTIEQTLHNLQIIMPYRLQCAFEIDIPSFRESLEDPDPNNQPHEALLNAIALMACYYDQTMRDGNRAQFFVERTRRSLQLSLTGVKSRKVIQQIQAGHLLSCYLYWTGSLLEGHAALAGAVSLARLCNLHKITSSDWRNRSDNLLEEPSAYRPQLRPLPSILDHSRARTAIEHGERIHCFWNLLLVDTGGSVSTGYPCQFTASDSDPGTKIETVYPLSLHEYMSVSARAQEPTSSYGDIFNPRYVSAQNDSPLVARIKGALLLHRAARLGTVGKAAHPGLDDEFSQQWFNLSQCLESFIGTLRPIPISAEARPKGTEITEERRDFLYMFIAWSLALCARVVMYNITPVAWRDTQRQTQAWSAADHIVQLIQTSKPSEDEMRMLDAMVGFSWMTAANFLISMRDTYTQKLGGPDNFDVGYVERLLDILDHATVQLATSDRRKEPESFGHATQGHTKLLQHRHRTLGHRSAHRLGLLVQPLNITLLFTARLPRITPPTGNHMDVDLKIGNDNGA